MARPTGKPPSPHVPTESLFKPSLTSSCFLLCIVLRRFSLLARMIDDRSPSDQALPSFRFVPFSPNACHLKTRWMVSTLTLCTFFTVQEHRIESVVLDGFGFLFHNCIHPFDSSIFQTPSTSRLLTLDPLSELVSRDIGKVSSGRRRPKVTTDRFRYLQSQIFLEFDRFRSTRSILENRSHDRLQIRPTTNDCAKTSNIRSTCSKIQRSRELLRGLKTREGRR